MTEKRHRKPGDLVVFDGPDAFADVERMQKDFEGWWSNLTPEQQDEERQKAQARLDALREEERKAA